MNKIEKIIALIILTIAVIYGAVYLFLNLAGKSIITFEIGHLTGKKTTIGNFNLSPSLNLEIKNLNVEGLAKIRSISVEPNVLGFFGGKAVFNNLRIVSPEITFVKTPPLVVSEGKVSTDVITPAKPPEPVQIKLLPLGFRRIVIENGSINYVDQSISAKGIKLVLKDINSKISNLYFYPRRIATAFELKGKIPWREGQDTGQLDIDGWINFYKQDMQVSFKIKDIDAIYLYPYYSTWVDLEKARIEKAKLNFSIDINGLNNNIIAECRLELTDMVRRPLEPGQSNETAAKITDKVLDIFKTADQGKVELNFTVKTKMDSPQLGLGNFKSAFEEKITKGRGITFKPEHVLSFPVKVVETGVRSFTDLTKAMIDGVFAVGGEVVKGGVAVFSKEEPAKTKQ